MWYAVFMFDGCNIIWIKSGYLTEMTVIGLIWVIVGFLFIILLFGWFDVISITSESASGDYICYQNVLFNGVGSFVHKNSLDNF